MVLFTVAAFITLMLVPWLEVPESGNPDELLIQLDESESDDKYYALKEEEQHK